MRSPERRVTLLRRLTRMREVERQAAAVRVAQAAGLHGKLIDLHGDVMTTLPIRDGETTADWTGLQHQTADEFGNPTDLTTGATRVTAPSSPPVCCAATGCG